MSMDLKSMEKCPVKWMLSLTFPYDMYMYIESLIFT